MDCASRVEQLVPACDACADRWASHRCPTVGSVWSRTTALWTYEGPVRAAVVAAKARGAWAGWDHLGDLLAHGVDEVLANGHGPAPEAVTWVPGRPDVIRRRGIDHTGVLATAVGDVLGIEPRALVGAGRAAGRRVGAAPGGRRVSHHAEPAFHALGVTDVPSRVLVVDDVLTTGATARDMAGVLEGLGVEHLQVAVLARSGGREPGTSGSP